MKIFTISQLEQFSGIKAHTIRIWEQRYNALQPSRSEGNTRYYDNSQLRRLLNIVSLQEFGYKPSKLGVMSDEQLFELIEKHLLSSTPKDATTEFYIAQLIAAGSQYDEETFSKILSKIIEEIGLKSVYTSVIYPLLVRIGYMWTQDSLVATQEHFISNLLKQKIYATLEKEAKPKVFTDKSWILFLPENEFHELGLLIASYLLRIAGDKVYYLGSNVPVESLAVTLDELFVSDALTFIVHATTKEEIKPYSDLMLDKNVRFFIGASELSKANLSSEITGVWLQNMDDLIPFIQQN